MSYTPQPNTNIWKLYQALTTEFQSVRELTFKVISQYPDYPKASLASHAIFLVDKKLVERRKIKDLYHYRLIENQPIQENLPSSKLSLPKQYFEYVQNRIGQTVTAKEIRFQFNRKEKDTGPGTVLWRLHSAGCLKLIENTKPYQYLVLPEIEKIEKVDWNKKLKPNQLIKKQPQEPHKDIANMSIAEMLTSYMSLKEENLRLKSVLRRLASELMTEIELD